MTARLSLLSFALACLLAAAPTPSGAGTLERDWCTGLSPVSWGFSITPPETCNEIRLRASSPNVRIVGAEPGPGLPEDWQVEMLGDAEVVARGTTPIRAGQTLRSCLLVETNRSSASIERRGVEPIEWELGVAPASGMESVSAPLRTSFDPVLELADAQSRGIVLVTVETHGAAGPVEITVDNPTWNPLWLDLPPGSVLEDPAGGEWVVGLTRPFRMMRKQKTGRTVAAFPLNPDTRAQAKPRRLRLANRLHERAPLIADLAMAVRQLEDAAADGARRPGRFESLEPFEFWPMVFRWAVWQETSQPGPEVLESLVRDLIESRIAAGDEHAGRLDPMAAVQEVERARQEALTLREGPAQGRLGALERASRVRFR